MAMLSEVIATVLCMEIYCCLDDLETVVHLLAPSGGRGEGSYYLNQHRSTLQLKAE
jgi:hypothetical protein